MGQPAANAAATRARARIVRMVPDCTLVRRCAGRYLRPVPLPDLVITSVDDAPLHCASAECIISFGDPGAAAPSGFHKVPKRLRLEVHDIVEREDGKIAPTRAHVEEIVRFADVIKDARGMVLIHCHAGISRSTASMTILLAEARPETDEDTLFAHIREIRPQAWPNSRMIGIADGLLGRGGRLVDALRRHYTEQMRQRPDLADMIGRAGRQHEVEMAI